MKTQCIPALLAALTLCLFSCGTEDPNQAIPPGCNTRAASEVTELSATLNGYARIGSADGEFTPGFFYSTDPEPTPDHSTIIPLSDKGMTASGKFTASTSGLKPNTTYYFRAYLCRDTTWIFGQTLSFTTAKIQATVTTGEAQDVTAQSARLTSSCTFTDNILPPAELIHAVYYLISDTASDPETIRQTGSRIDASPGKTWATLDNLKKETTYHYMAAYIIEGLDESVFGQVQSFFTTDKPQETLHKCSETRITDDMIFSSCCARTRTSVQQGFDYDPVDNTLYFFQLNRWYRNIIGWTRPEVTLSTDVAPHYMGLRCFSHGNNITIERTPSGEKYVWAPNFGPRGDGSYGNPWIVSRLPLQETSGVNQDIRNTDPDDNYYFGVTPCWPAIDFEADRIAICTYKKVYVYRLSEIQALPKTLVRIPAEITYGGIMTSSASTTTYDSGIPEFTGHPEVLAHDATQVTPLIVFDSNYSKRGLHWQTFCISGGKAYFLCMGDVPENSIIRHDTYIEVYDLNTGELIRPKVRQEYIQDIEGLVARGYVESDYCYAEPEGIKVLDNALYVLYTCRGNTNITTRRPVIFKLSTDL